MVANIHHKRWCFAVWLVTNTAWAAVDFWYGIYSQATLQAVYAWLSVYVIVKWRKDQEENR